MKIKVCNLGVVKEANIDLKPLTIFIGPNNSGKTWLAYILAGLLGPRGFSEYSESLKAEEISANYKTLDKAIKQVLNRGTASIDLVQFTKEYGETYFNNVARAAKNWLPESMSTRQSSFKDLDIQIDLAETMTGLIENVLNYSLRHQIPASPQKPLLSFRKNRGEAKLFIFTSSQDASLDATSNEEQVDEALPQDIIKDLLINNVLIVLHRSLYPHVRILPTERTTFITFPFSSRKRDNRERLTSESQTAENENAIRMSGAVGYFMDMIQSAYDSEEEGAQREKSAKNNSKIRKYIQIAQLLEQKILSGKVEITSEKLGSSNDTFQSEEEAIRRAALFQISSGSKLEIAVASSMVKELSPLVLYLRYVARPGELLIIDEPEMNLHPEAQAEMIELLAMLVNSGLNILITTHSPYVIDHLSNLLKAYEVENNKDIGKEFYLQRNDAFISKDKVSIYLFNQQGKPEGAMNEDGVIELGTFGAVSDNISDIYFKLK